MKPFRNITPKRTCAHKYKEYSAYKPYLRSDFSKRCGYCDDIDTLCGGARGFHIDHFRPRSPFNHLSNEYNNLVYACPYCNGAKSNDWPSGKEDIAVLDDGRGYIDPCDLDFDKHFERHNNGRIRPKTEIGKYMYKQLKLGLRRHQLAWAREQLGNSLRELLDELEKTELDSNTPVVVEAKNHLTRLIAEFFKYQNLFEETI